MCSSRTLPSVATSDISLLPFFAANTRATSRSFRPHSSVFVARKMQAAAISYKSRFGGMREETRRRQLDLFWIVIYRIPHVEPVVPSRGSGHSGERAMEMGLNEELHGGCRGALTEARSIRGGRGTQYP